MKGNGGGSETWFWSDKDHNWNEKIYKLLFNEIFRMYYKWSSFLMKIMVSTKKSCIFGQSFLNFKNFSAELFNEHNNLCVF